jgi:hypothetical protein
MTEQELEFPVLMAKQDDTKTDFILWSCSRISDDECVSVFLNYVTKEQVESKIPISEVVNHFNTLAKEGWQRRYIPKIEIHSDIGIKMGDQKVIHNPNV